MSDRIHLTNPEDGTPRLVQGLRWLDPTTFVIRVDRQGLQFHAGQCVSLGLWRSGVNREYSIYSGENEEHLDFLVKVVEHGTVSRDLARLSPGDRVYLAGPYSDFALPPPDRRHLPALFVATGTGIAPFHSFVRTVPGLDYRILHGIRTADLRYDRDHYAPERYIPCLSRADDGGRRGRVTDFLRAAELDPGAEVYLCGNHAMIEEVFEIVTSRGISPDRVHSEVFF